jgi:hypothetical protein
MARQKSWSTLVEEIILADFELEDFQVEDSIRSAKEMGYRISYSSYTCQYQLVITVKT